MLFLRKKKLDRNNIPVYKISFENAFSIEKRLPWRNRWEKFLAFKQITITCLSNSMAFERHLCCAVLAVLWRHTVMLACLLASSHAFGASWRSSRAVLGSSHAINIVLHHMQPSFLQCVVVAKNTFVPRIVVFEAHIVALSVYLVDKRHFVNFNFCRLSHCS